ncbi:hypothetical protein PO909_022978 [Leuciscus waleckii]
MDNSSKCCAFDAPILDEVLPPVLFFEFILGLMGNVLACESFNICLGHNALSDWHNSFYVIQFFVPTCIVVYCTACITWQLKSKTVDTQGKIKRAVQFILAVALVFIICFFPSNVSRIAVTVCFTYFNSVLNPIVYYFSSPAFRKKMEDEDSEKYNHSSVTVSANVS